jgi:hypothetical protein
MTVMHFTKAPEGVAACRDFVEEALRSCPVELFDRAVLVTSELASNVIRHTQNGGLLELAIGSYQLQLRSPTSATIASGPSTRSVGNARSRDTHCV